MPAPLRIILTEEEDRTLSELREAQTVPYRTRDRAHMLRLNAQGLNVPAIAAIFQCHQHTVRATLRRWESDGLGGLWEAPGRGAKPKWQRSLIVVGWVDAKETQQKLPSLILLRQLNHNILPPILRIPSSRNITPKTRIRPILW